MAIKISNIQIEKAEENFFGKNFTKKNLFLRIFLKTKKKILIKLKNYINYILRLKKIITLNKQEKINYKINFDHLNSESFEKLSQNYLNEGYCYIDNFINEEYYENILKNWPEKFFFYTADNPFKNYNFAFRYCSDKIANVYPKTELKNLVYFPVIDNFYNTLEYTEIFSEFIKKITKENGYKFYSAACSIAQEGSFLAPHIDSVYNDKTTPNMLNMIYFVDGGDDVKNSGGTGIYSDNDFKQPLLLPKKLKNSVLIYNSKNNFFHGFDLMTKNNYRKAITFQFKHHCNV